jgi:eukaryotic-like serine/threonine-protein kinase
MTSGTDSGGSHGAGLSPAEIEALLFSAAMSFDAPEERERFLGFACRGEPDLHARVRRYSGLLSAADEFFEFETQVKPVESGVPHAEEPDGLGVEVGRYRLIERIGSGGCGVVYLAEQQEPVRRKVALKIIRIGLESPEAVARFEMERQALASMNHPNIARVLDAGTNASGRPFFVMELVAGESIADYCDARKLGIRERLQLFVQVCQAIQHAHQKGVIHRDIKPSNVLVETHESTPVPKIIDFGIAQEEGSGGMDAGEGKPAGFVGSPVSMSPEQVSGTEAVDTRSDIYSLGMLLAELLVGPHRHLPTDLMEHPPDEIRRILIERRPALPSTAFESNHPEQQQEIARDRSIRPEALIQICRRELDWLVGKAIQRDPSRRYDTANALAADVLRWLHGEAIYAHPPTRGYRLAKLVGRNRLVFGSGALAFLGLLGGFSVATVLFLREKEARAAEVRLRAQAERAHRAETLARKSWEYRSRVSESAVRLRYGDHEGAEKIVEPIPIDETPPSLESTAVCKQLAEWHRVHGRTEQAEKRYFGMIHALSKIDRSHTDANSDLFLPAAAMLARASDPQRYAELRRIALDLYGNTPDRLIAERILKVCLLKPTPQADLQQTAKLVATLEGIAEHQPGVELLSWEYLSVAMHCYRMAEYEKAGTLANRSLQNPKAPHLNVLTARVLMGLVWKQRGNEIRSKDFLTSVAAEAAPYLQALPANHPGGDANWYDWLNLRTLLEEAGWKEGAFPRER